MKCSRCGRNIPNTAKFCRYCGARAAAPQRSPAPAGRPQQRGRRQQSGANGFLILRVILIVICVGLVGVGIWKIPGNVKTIIASHARPVSEPEPSSGSKSHKETHPASTLSPEELAAIHEEIARIDEEQAAGVTEDPAIAEEQSKRDLYHDMAKSWFQADPTEPEEAREP
ncbi:MAG: zinc ribbon domain-containing protein [Oscillospiraceae bacterium]|nr:zinc ribbon domain-containing protein [Oscillospiraceae bacterium]